MSAIVDVSLGVEDGTLVVRSRCTWCHGYSALTVPAAGFYAWQHGAYIQNAFPDLSADQRELLISGTHAKCWDEFMPDDDED